MVQTIIFLEKYLIIMGIVFIAAFFSILFGVYYLIKYINLIKASKTKQSQKYIIAAFIYLVFFPILLIIIGHNFLVPLFAISGQPIEVEANILLKGTEIVHNTSPLYMYLTIFLTALVIYAIVRLAMLEPKE